MTERVLFRVEIVEDVCECDLCKEKVEPVTTRTMRYPTGLEWSKKSASDRLVIVSAIGQLGQAMAQWGCPELKTATLYEPESSA